ncbi:MAG TPA: hypothetical protein P5121_15095 [Caldilineaceae bacterium]|nr:hypothetical protein [Caldilineaceae bacterium]
MHSKRHTVSTVVMVVLILMVTSGCGRFGGAARERANDNAAITEGIDLGRVVMAEGIGADNAPVGETDTFNDTQDYIYMVAEADYIASGTTLFARWYRDGEPIEDSSEITANQNYENTYIEFHLENLQDRMETGDYSVQLFANGNPIEEVAFTVE